MNEKELQHVFIIGSKGIPGLYGGYETFVDKLTEYHQNNTNIKYHVACKGSEKKECEYHNARCFYIKVPNIGPAQAIYYDVVAFDSCCTYIKRKKIQHAIVYVLACRIGPFAAYLKKRLHKLGGVLYVNPDGHEWMRAKWNKAIRKYWKFSEKRMVKHADLLVCDSKNMESYIQNSYQKYRPKTVFAAYGADVAKSGLSDEDPKLCQWYRKWDLIPLEYFLIVGRFVPENNYETMIREFMASGTGKKLAIISNVEENAFYQKLKEATGFEKDPRIVFCQTVYDEQLLKKIRENAFAYLHGHEVGGTNPSLLEALGSTDINLLLDVGFNREVGEEAALYWTKQEGSLSSLIEETVKIDAAKRQEFGAQAKKRILDHYSHEQIARTYEHIFLR